MTDPTAPTLHDKREQLRRRLEDRLRAAPPLTVGQRALWFLQQIAPESAAYNIAITVSLPPGTEAEAVAWALNGVAERHPALRTSFRTRAGEPAPEVHPPGGLDVEALEVPAGGLAEAARERFERPFDLGAAPPVRAHLLSAEGAPPLLLLVVHHVVADAIALRVVADEALRLLEARAAGRPAGLPPPATTFAAYVREEHERMAGLDGERMWQYWRGQFPDGLPTLDLGGRTGPGGKAVHVFRWQGPLVEALAAFRAETGATPFATLLAAFAVVLQRYARQDVVPVGTAVHGRTRPEHYGLVGYCANPVLLGLDLSGGPSFREVVGQVQERLVGALDHQGFPFPLLAERLAPERGPDGATLQVLFTHQDAAASRTFGGAKREVGPDPADAAAVEATAAVLEATLHRGGNSALSLEMFSADGAVLGGLAVDTAVIPEAAAPGIADALRTVLGAALDAPDRPISALPLRPGAPESLDVPGGLDVEAPPDATVHGRFEALAAAAPHAVAVEAGAARWTYAELDARADRVAEEIGRLGDEGPVALALDRSPALVAAMLGALKAGRPYLPLDLRQPPERARAVLEDAGARVVVASGGLEAPSGVAVLDLDGLGLEAVPAPSRPARRSGEGDGEAPAYVVYTSGSTGQPKGVVVPHRAVVRLVVGTDYVQLGPDDRVAHLSSPAFDATTFEVWGPLLTGGRVVVVEAEAAVDPERLPVVLRERGVTTAFVTTALFNLIARHAPDAFRPLRHVLFGGERVDPASVARVLRHGPPGALIHVYGPTEATTFSTWHRVREVPDGAAAVPIGGPVAGATLHVLDPAGHPVPDGFTSELHIGGSGLALGYLGKPDLTRAAFQTVTAPGGAPRRLYRTGDLVRQLPGGAVEFVGRADRQVKVRGFRVEPGEVEAALRRHPGVASCAVVPTPPSPAGRTLLAYAVAEAGGPEPSPADLRAHCRRVLPDYMVPTRIALVPKLPLTPNGKVDRRALRMDESDGRAAEPLRDPVERELARLYSEVLGRRGLGRNAHFFHLGGHSLLAASLVARIRDSLGVTLPLRSLFAAPELGDLADLVRRRGDDHAAAVPVQPFGARPPVFLVPGAAGDATQFVALSRALGDDQPLYVLEARGRDGREDPDSSVADMAAYGIETMRSVQPEGPYVLLGYSLGGLVALEMANALADQGDEVAVLGILDTVLPRAAFSARHAVTRRVAQVRELGLASFARRLVYGLALRVREARTRELHSRSYRRHREQGLDVPPAVVWEHLYRVHRRAFARHVARPHPGRLVLFRTSGHAPYVPRDLGWGPLAEGGVEVLDLPGDHTTILRPPAVSDLAAALRSQVPDALGFHTSGDGALAGTLVEAPVP